MDAKNTVLSRTTKLNVDEIEAFADYLPEINLEVPEVDMNKVFSSASEILRLANSFCNFSLTCIVVGILDHYITL